MLPLDLSYEVDLWGRVRRSFRAAREQAQASAAAYQNVLLSLQADVAQTYFMIRSIDLDRHVVAETIELRKKNLTLVESLHQGGADSALDVGQAANGTGLRGSGLWWGWNCSARNWKTPWPFFAAGPRPAFRWRKPTRLYQPPVIPIGLPADLLERRPDVAEAERSMAAASEGIGVAKAAYFPSIQLTGSAGAESAELKDIFNWENRAWSIGPNISLPLFEGGRNRAGVERAEAAYQEAVAQYRSQVLVAFHEVEDGLVGLRLLKEQFDAQTRAVDAAKQVADLSREPLQRRIGQLFRSGAGGQNRLENQILAYQLNGQRIVTTILLVKALGGGWKADNAMMTNSVAPIQQAK